MKTIKTKNATGTLGKMVSEVNPVQLAKMRNRMLIAAKIADANIGTVSEPFEAPTPDK